MKPSASVVIIPPIQMPNRNRSIATSCKSMNVDGRDLQESNVYPQRWNKLPVNVNTFGAKLLDADHL
jgi:hypothetical protein